MKEMKPQSANTIPFALLTAVAPLHEQTDEQAEISQSKDMPPNILVIMADDIGCWNIGSYNLGMMGVPTPNINQLARNGKLFTDHYGASSGTAGRAMFITGQLPIRTGLTNVGMPGSPIGLSKADPTLAEVLKYGGYLTGQYGKNHLGERNEHLPTVHGFDEFYGNLYPLNVYEEPVLKAWPKEGVFNQKFRPRGVLHCLSTDIEDETFDPRYGIIGKQTILDTGPLTPERMETIDDEYEKKAINFMRDAVQQKRPFFVWHNPTRMHYFTHLREDLRESATPFTSEFDVYGDGMIELDNMVGRMVDALEVLNVIDNTIIIFTSDNGPITEGFPDSGYTPFRGEQATTWEGGVRVPLIMQWPNRIMPGTISNGIQDHTDLFATLASAAQVSNDIHADLKDSRHVYIDGINNITHWTDEIPSKRRFEIYYNESDLTAVRIGNWKTHLKTRDGYFECNKSCNLLFNLRMDPMERIDDVRSRMMAMRLGMAWGGRVNEVLREHYATFLDFPPRGKGGLIRQKR